MLHRLFIDHRRTASLDLLLRRYYYFLQREHAVQTVQQGLLRTVQTQRIRTYLRLNTEIIVPLG